MRTFIRICAWLLTLTIIALSIVPPSIRPTTSVPQAAEHAVIYLVTGMAFGIGYAGKWKEVTIGLVSFAGVVEFLQLFAPGRHARIGDFIIDAAAGCVGVGMAWMLVRAHKLLFGGD